MTELQAAESTHQPGFKRLGCLVYAIAFLLVLFMLVSVSFMGWYGSSRSSLESELQRIRSRGEPVWLSDLAPKEVDPEEDGTAIYMVALSKLKPVTQGFHELLSAEPATPPGKYLEFESLLEQNRPALELLAQAVRKPYFRLDLDYDTTQPFAILLGPIQNARDFGRLLQADVLQSIGEGNTDRAIGAIQDSFGLCEMLRDEPFFISQLVRIAIGATAINSLKIAVAHLDLTPGQFAEIDDQLALMENRFALAPSALAERAAIFTTMDHLHENAGLIQESPGDSFSLGVFSYRAFRPYVMSDEAFMLQIMSDFAANIDKPGPEGTQAIEEINERVRTASIRYVLTRLLTPAVLQCRAAGLKHRQRLATARLGLRVARYYADHGKFPESLGQITDDKLSKLPVDLFSGRPLIYKVLPDGFMIYPVGENGVDNGGGMQPDNTEGSCNFEVKYPRLAPGVKRASDEKPE